MGTTSGTPVRRGNAGPPAGAFPVVNPPGDLENGDVVDVDGVPHLVVQVDASYSRRASMRRGWLMPVTKLELRPVASSPPAT